MLLIPRRDASVNQRNLARLSLLRTILLAGLLAALGIAEWGLAVPVFGDVLILLSLLLLVAFNAWTFWRLRQRYSVSEAGLFAQLVVDVVLMTIILYRTGGATNPFVSWYLVPLTIAAATLRMPFTLSLAGLTLLAYSVLLFHYVPFAPFGGPEMATPSPDNPHAHHQMMAPSGVGVTAVAAQGFNLHIFGMWLNFVLSAGLITFFVSRMSHALREQDKQLAEQHERLLQREQVVSLGALAAGAAHELGTPLSTMSVIARDIEQELPADSPLREDIVMLRRQLALCREVLGDLREQAAGEGLPGTLQGLVAAAIVRMEVVHPRCRFEFSCSAGDVAIKPPSTLLQVMVNLLDNAAQAARQRVAIALVQGSAECCVEITDDGDGVDPAVAARLGQPFVTSKEDGMGIGYFLSHASINALGGRIEISSRVEGGARTCLWLPWSALGVVRVSA